MVSKTINIAMRGLQFLWALLIMALVGDMIATSFAGDHSMVNFDMFVAVFAMLSLFYLIAATIMESIFVPIAVITLDVLNTVFFLIGGIATAAYLGVHSCSNDEYTERNVITNGSHNRGKRCREAQAVTAFLWFGFAAFAASAVLSFAQSRGSANMRSGGIRRGPTMSQV